ncbi:MAG: glycosyltransferase family 1 protein [Bacteroidia bacterium]
MAVIAINTRLMLDGKLDGIGWFTFETLRRITIAHPEHQFLFIFDRPFPKKFVFASNVRAVYVGPPTRHISLFVPWFELVIPRLLKKSKADLFISTDGHIPLRGKVPCLPVIHDINFFHFPEQLPFLVRKYYNYFFPRFARKAARITTVSQYTKNDLINSYGINEAKIDVALNGVNDKYTPLSAGTNGETRNKYTGGCGYFLFIGLIIPRKNLRRLIEAYFEFRKKENSTLKLLVVGNKKWWSSTDEQFVQGREFGQDVLFAGRLDADEFHKVISAAFALTFVPLFEGFGIPVLEAFACGVPVIASNVTSLPEVGGEAAIYCDPTDVNSICEAMQKVSNDENLRKSMIAKGLERVKLFSWDKTAQAFWNSIERCLKP